MTIYSTPLVKWRFCHPRIVSSVTPNSSANFSLLIAIKPNPATGYLSTNDSVRILQGYPPRRAKLAASINRGTAVQFSKLTSQPCIASTLAKLVAMESDRDYWHDQALIAQADLAKATVLLMRHLDRTR